MSKKVLLVSELFEPMNRIGAVRPSKLAKYLTRNGVDVTVFTSYKTIIHNTYSPDGFIVLYDKALEDEHSDVRSHKEAAPHCKSTLKTISPFRKELSLIYRQFLAYKEGKLFCRRFMNAVNNGIINLKEYDYIFTTFGPIGPVLTGIKIKQLNHNIKWINDFRDPMVSKLLPSIAKPLYGHIQKKSIILSDYVTTVSEGYKNRIQIVGEEGKVQVIPNGFDVDDKPLKCGKTCCNSKFTLSYMGSLYEGKRDIGPLFKALRRLSDECVLSVDNMEFNYAGKDFNYLLTQAEKYNMEEIIHDYGFLSRKDCLQLQSESRFLVLSTWNEKGEEGVFPGKLIEYMLMEKPIISIVDGSVSCSEVTRTIKRLSLGVSYESADPKTENELYEWLKAQAVQYKEGRQALFSPDYESLYNMYDWRRISERFCKIING